MLHSCSSPFQGFLFLAGWCEPGEGWAEGYVIMCPCVGRRFGLLQGSMMERDQELLTSPFAEQLHNPALQYERPAKKKIHTPKDAHIKTSVVWKQICCHKDKTFVSHPKLFLRADFEWQKNMISQVALTQSNFLSLWEFLNIAAQSTVWYSANKL